MLASAAGPGHGAVPEPGVCAGRCCCSCAPRAELRALCSVFCAPAILLPLQKTFSCQSGLPRKRKKQFELQS